MRTTSRTHVRVLRAAAVGAFFWLGACAPQYSNHGYIPPAEELAEIKVGSDTRASVMEKVGAPTSAGVLNDSGYYYVRSRRRAVGPFAPQEIDRQVLAISFSSAGIVQNVERFGLERGKVIPLERRVTSSPTSNTSFIKQLLGNLGRFGAGGLGG